MKFLINYMKATLASDRTKLHARDSVYWPSINKDIECLVKTCDLCQEHSCRNNKDLIIQGIFPFKHGQQCRQTYSHWMVTSFLLVVDVTSRFPVVRILKNEMATSVLMH